MIKIQEKFSNTLYNYEGDFDEFLDNITFIEKL